MKLLELDLRRFDTLFLDRDGVINCLRVGDYVKCWEEFVFMPGILEALAVWNSQFKRILIVTNQRGVGRGFMTEEELTVIHEKMLHVIESHGGRIDRIYCCTAVSDADVNRKPNAGMAVQAKRDFPEIDFTGAVMIGDSQTDMLFAQRMEMEGILYKES
jgi:histidinol-phosphate phosphatase family protein